MTFRLRDFTRLLPLLLIASHVWANPSGSEVVLTQPGISADEVKRRIPKIAVREVKTLKPPRNSTEPTQAEIARALEQASLTETVANWDTLDKDLFALRARKYPLDKLGELYPTLPPEGIRRFQTSLKGQR